MSDAVERLREGAANAPGRDPAKYLAGITVAECQALLAHIADLEARCATAHAAGVAEERARSAAWLLKFSGHSRERVNAGPTFGEAWVLHRAADAIEAGQHERTDDVAAD